MKKVFLESTEARDPQDPLELQANQELTDYKEMLAQLGFPEQMV